MQQKLLEKYVHLSGRERTIALKLIKPFSPTIVILYRFYPKELKGLFIFLFCLISISLVILYIKYQFITLQWSQSLRLVMVERSLVVCFYQFSFKYNVSVILTYQIIFNGKDIFEREEIKNYFSRLNHNSKLRILILSKVLTNWLKS